MAELIHANVFRNFAEGMEAGQRQQARNALMEYLPAAMNGDQNALSALASTNPRIAMQLWDRAEDRAYRDEMRGYRRNQETRATAAEERAQAAHEALMAKCGREDGAAALRADMDKDRRYLQSLVPLYQQGDRDGFAATMQDFIDTDPEVAELGQHIPLTFDNMPQLMALYSEEMDTATKVLAQLEGKSGGDQRDRKIDEYQRVYGYDEATAMALADGLISHSRNPYKEELEYFDIRDHTPNDLQRNALADAMGSASMPPPALPSMDTTSLPQSFAPEPVQPAHPENPPAPNATSAPTGAENAFGLRGLGGRAINSVTDAVTGKEAFPELAEHQRFFRTLEEDLLVHMAQAYGRQPAQGLLERLRRLAPNAGTAAGAGAAIGELEQLKRKFERDLRVIVKSSKRRLSPEERTKANAAVTGLETSLEMVNEALARFGRGSGANRAGKTKSGLSWKVVQ